MGLTKTRLSEIGSRSMRWLWFFMGLKVGNLRRSEEEEEREREREKEREREREALMRF